MNFVERLGIQPAHEVLTNAAEYLPYIDAAMRTIVIRDESWQWVKTMLGYFIGEYFVQGHAGCWYVETRPESPHFCRTWWAASSMACRWTPPSIRKRWRWNFWDNPRHASWRHLGCAARLCEPGGLMLQGSA